MNRRSIPHKVRQWLVAELESWRTGGILSDDQTNRILALYETPAEASRRNSSTAIFALCGVATLMIGLAVLLVVGFNWQAMPAAAKLTVLLGSLVGSFLAAMGMRYGKQWRLTSEVVLLLTGILYGVNIWLIAQIFNIQSHYPNGFLFWALGVLPLALCLDTLLLHGLYAVLLAAWVGTEILGFPAFHPWLFHWRPMIPNGAYLLPVLALPGLLWAYRKRSAATVAIYVPLLAWWLSLQPVAWHCEELVLPAIALAGSLLLLAAEGHPRQHPLASPYRNWGVLILAGALIPLSFATIVAELLSYHHDHGYPVAGLALGAVGVATLLGTVSFKLRLAQKTAAAAPASEFARMGLPIASTLFTTFFCVWIGLLGSENGHGGISLLRWTPQVLVPALLANVAMIFLAICLMREGLQTDRGRLFAGGVLYFLFWSVLRYCDLFADVGGMLGAALMFLLCGVGLFACARFWHHRREALATEAAAHLASQSSFTPMPSQADGRPDATTSPSARTSRWNFLVIGLKAWEKSLLTLGMAFQLTVLIGMIAGRTAMLQSGETVLLRVTPVDPRDLFRGDYVTLGYDFSRAPSEGIPGLGTLDDSKPEEWQGQTVFVELLPEEDGKHYRAGAFSLTPPGEGKFIRGTINSARRIEYGIESFYVQEREGTKFEEAARQRKLSAEVALMSDGRAALRGLHIDETPGDPATTVSKEPPPTWPSHTIYRVCYLPDADIEITGKADNPIWSRPNVEKQFTYPWNKDATPPATEFRAFCTRNYLYFAFHAEDSDIVTAEEFKEKHDVVDEDRVELFMSRDPSMRDYYCFEIDPLGRTYDYRASFHRKFDPTWSCPGLETKGTLTANGYVVEGRIPLESLVAMGFPRLVPGMEFLCGIYRGEYSHIQDGASPAEPSEPPEPGHETEKPKTSHRWISWIAPKTPRPEFHVPGSLGQFEIVE